MTEEKNKKSIRRVFLSISFLIMTLLVILLAEFVLRQTGKFPLSPIVYDDDLIWRMKPDQVDVKNTYGVSFTVKLNSKGFHDIERDYSRSFDKKRVLVIGDSYTAGADHHLEETFTALTEQALNSASEKEEYEFINAGNPGWSTDQHLLFLKGEGLKYQPDEVLLVVCPNDIREAYNRKLFTLKDSKLVYEKHYFPRKERIFWWLSNRLSIYQFIQNKITHSHYGSNYHIWKNYSVNFGFADSLNWDHPLYLKPKPKPVKEAEQLFYLLLNEIKLICATNNIKFTVSVIPTKLEFNTNIDTLVYEMGRLTEDIKNFCEAEQISYVNLYKEFESDKNPSRFFLENDFHFNKAGHLKASEVISNYYSNN